ncbi:MAG: hypothetical protein AAGI88_19770 [Pseudomonadota bacterium]
MRELSIKEREEVSGGLSLESGGLALIGIGLSTVTVTSLGAFAFGIGVPLLIGSIYLGSFGGGGGGSPWDLTSRH